MYSRDACIHLCAMMVHVCMHSYTCQDAFIIWCMCVAGLFLPCDNESCTCVRWLRYAGKVLQGYVFLDNYSFLFLYFVEPIPTLMNMYYISPYLCTCTMKANTHSWIHICTYTRICRERCNLWHVTFLRVKFLTHVFTRMYSYVWHDGSYIHSCSGRDAFVITFFSCVVGLFDTRDNESFLCYDGVYLRFCSTVYPHRCMSTYWEKVCKYLFM